MLVCGILLCFLIRIKVLFHSVGITFLVNEFLFVYSYGYVFPPVNCEREGICVSIKFC